MSGADLNIYGEPLRPCCMDPVTGFSRDGHCRTGPMDLGRHVICARVTEEFLEFSKSRGNDLTTPIPDYGFPGLKPGDQWCLCAERWREAHQAGFAPPVLCRATHQEALKVVSKSVLEEFGLE